MAGSARALHSHQTPPRRLPLNSNDELQRDVIGPNLSLLLHHGSEFTSQRNGIDFRIASGHLHLRLRLWLCLCLCLYRGGIRPLSAALYRSRGGSYPLDAALRLGGIRSFPGPLYRSRGGIGWRLPATNRERSETAAGFQLLLPLGFIEKQISGRLRPKTASHP
jgi:hypothetical protein